MDIVKYLVEKGANVNVEDFDKDTPLFTTETVDMAKLLVELGADPKKKNELGLTAAMTAYDEGWEDVAEFLIDITGEELPTFEQEEEVDDLAHTQQDDDDEELTPAMNNKLQEILQKIEEQGGVDDEEKLREMVMNMLLEEMQGAGVDADDVEDEEK